MELWGCVIVSSGALLFDSCEEYLLGYLRWSLAGGSCVWKVSGGIANVLRKCPGSVGSLRFGELLFLLLCGWSSIRQEFGGGGGVVCVSRCVLEIER